MSVITCRTCGGYGSVVIDDDDGGSCDECWDCDGSGTLPQKEETPEPAPTPTATAGGTGE